ncbi:TspO/MBR family protein [Mucilaginibacter ginkgonis]|uniref:Tryptophan-rich sensory protein n=1 Tax=Mucilaginibacter ginkgonis TaxID=2682091 RepID=A0A6I4I287_9SPHI|nr:TspO/MBR family protein [Mucilaginibacter ginkgonis]QQL50732.1 tryptophan-rich sensory protein [Mucilaginibacter ginkgonis]
MPNTSSKFQPIPYAVSLAMTLAIGGVASLFTRPEIEGWYSRINKPSFTPPSWAFPIAWTILYIMIATAAYLVWKKREPSIAYKNIRSIYFTQLFFNFIWSIVFFGMHQILGGLVIIIVLWLLIIFNIFAFARLSKPAAWLLVPYLLWVSFATALNFSIYLLNN